MSKPPHVNPISDIPSSSSSYRRETPRSSYNFYLIMTPLRKLRLIFQALANPTFNDNGFGQVHVDKEHFHITVENGNNACARLRLNASGMDYFIKPESDFTELVRLGPISESFPAGLESLDWSDDAVHIFNRLGSNQLCFKFGDGPLSTEFSTTFIMCPTHFRRFQLFTPDCSIPVPTEGLREMINYLRNTSDTSLVDVGILRHSALFEIGSGQQWEHNYIDTEVGRIRGMSSSAIHRECINWTYNTFLLKASYLAPDFVMHFMPAPDGDVIFQFTMQDLGELVMMKRKILMIPNVDTAI